MSTDQYHPSAGYENEDPIDRLSRCLSQAFAMSQQTYGGGTALECSEHVRDAFLWGLSDKIGEARAAFDELCRRHRKAP